MTSDEKYKLSMKLSRALADYLDGVGTYPMDYVRMALAEYLVDEVIEEAMDDMMVRALAGRL